MSIISDIGKYTRLAWDLRSFLNKRITLEQSKEVISARIRNRGKTFLEIVQKAIYKNPGSPYLELLRIAGCEFGDIETNVIKDGIELTLQKLRSAGVYLSYEEFKKNSEVVRGSQRFRFKPSDFDNPDVPVYYRGFSSGSRSSGTRTTFDLKNQADMSYYRLPLLLVNESMDIPVGLYKPILPASSGIGNSLRQWKAGRPIVRWFTPVNENQVRASFRDKLALKYILYGSLVWGAKLAKPEYVDLEDARKVAQWIADTKQKSGSCCLISSVSPVVKISHASIEHKIDIQGTHFIVSGEPLTDAKHKQIVASGATVTTRYTMSEIGGLGYGCLQSKVIDDVHFFHDSCAIIQHQKTIQTGGFGTIVNAFLCTTLLPSAPRILLNVESDDYGVMESRKCDCLFGQLGFNTHIHHIRSYAKLTGVGMTIINTDLVRILEEVLPLKYGGSASDYQLLEEEDNSGRTHMNLIISPGVGELPEEQILATVLDELRHVQDGGRLAAGVWGQEKTLSIKRMTPISNSGKVMTLQLRKSE